MTRPRKLCEMPRGSGGPCSKTATATRRFSPRSRRKQTYNLCAFHIAIVDYGKGPAPLTRPYP